jgi:hypothetical protein
MVKVTLYFKNGGKMGFKCKSFNITKDSNGGYSNAEWKSANQIITFQIDEVIGVVIKKAWF